MGGKRCQAEYRNGNKAPANLANSSLGTTSRLTHDTVFLPW